MSIGEGHIVRLQCRNRFDYLCYATKVNSLDVKSVDLKGGRAKCPYDPSSNYTIVYSDKYHCY